MALQVVEKGIYQVMSDGTKTCVPFGITKREREREMKRERERERDLTKGEREREMKGDLTKGEYALDMLRDCFKRIAAETGIPAREMLANIFEYNGWNDDPLASRKGWNDDPFVS